MNITNIVFDLDGTLIDSAPSILTTLGEALSIHKLQSILSLEASIIGPPLREIFARLTGRDDTALLNSLIDTFKSQYDTVGYKTTATFPGVPELLKGLAQRDIPIYIATNTCTASYFKCTGSGTSGIGCTCNGQKVIKCLCP